MILMVSGRTDIVAFYSQWFIKRLEAGFVDVRNPFNASLVSRIFFEDVEAFLFCTKNPLPILPVLDKLKKPILFHVTITPYGSDIEPNVIDKRKVIDGVKKIAEVIGKEHVFVRYDPVFINEKYSIDYHIKAFGKLCTLLEGSIQGFVFSFLDNYKNVQKNYHVLRPKVWSIADYEKLGMAFSQAALEHGLTIQTCAETMNLCEYGFIKGECLSKEMAEKLTGRKNFKKWVARKSKACECVQMVDIGVYNSCNHLCKYCYANFDEKMIEENRRNHDVNSSLLVGTLDDNCKIVRRRK